MEGKTFANCIKLEKIQIPKSLEVGGSYYDGGAFQGCKVLTEVTFEEGITKIGDYLFAGCESITSITIPDSVTEIGYRAFQDATGLTNVTIGSNVEIIRDYAFRNCTRLADIVIPDKVTQIGICAFEGCKSLETVQLSKNLVKMEQGAFVNCTRLNHVTIPKSLEQGGDYNQGAFAGSSNLTDVTFEEGTTKIADYLFSDCTAITEITIPDTVTEIGQYAFYGCNRITEIVIPDTVTEIGRSAFSKAVSLEKVTLGKAVETIGVNAFYECSRITEISFPDSLTTMGSSAFGKCTGLTEVVIPSGLSDGGDWSEGAFYGCNNLTKVTFEEGTTKIADGLFAGCTGSFEVTIPDTVTEIGDYAFYRCSGLTKVTAAENQITKIGYGVFGECSSLTEIECGEFSPLAVYAVDNNYPLSIVNDKFEDSKLLALDRSNTNLILNSNSIKVNGYMTMIIDYAIKDNIIGDIYNKKINVKIPQGSELISKSVTLDGEQITGYTDNTDSDGTLSVPVTNQKGQLRMSVRVTNAVNLAAYAQLEYRDSSTWNWKSETIGVINSGEEILTIESNSLTDKSAIQVAGVAPAEQKVSLYIGDTLIKETVANRTGSFRETVTIPDAKDGVVYHVRAVSTDSEGESLEALCKVKYEENAPVLARFDMYYNGNRYDLKNNTEHPNITFVPGKSYSFRITFENREKIDKVFVTSDRSGITKYIEAKWDERKQAYLAEGPFEASNSSYVPGTMNVYYTLKKETVNLEEFSNTFIEKDELPEEWQNVTVNVNEETDRVLDADITFTDGAVVSYRSRVMDEEEAVAYLESLVPEDATSDAVEATNAAVEEQIETYSSDTEEKIAKLMANFALNVSSKEFVAAVRQDDEEITTILWDTAKGTVKSVVIEDPMEKVITGGMEELAGDMISSEAIGSIYSIATDSVKAGITYGNTTYDLNAIEKEIKYSNRTDAEKTALLQDVKVCKQTAGAIAAGRIVASVIKESGKLTMAANPLLGIGLYAGGIIFDKVFLDYYEAELNESIGCLKGLPYGSKANWAIDPSGYVYEGVTDNRLQGVKTTIYYKENLDAEAVLWDASQYNQMNPLYTDNDGFYAWDVPEGMWQVKFEKEGYESTYSEWMEVPPPQTDVNIGMTALSGPAIENIRMYEDYAEITFSQYMIPETISNIQLKNADGTVINYSLDYDKEQKAVDGTIYAKTYRLIYNMPLSDKAEYTVAFDKGIKNYAGKELDTANYTKKLENKQTITIAKELELAYGETVLVPYYISNYVSGQAIECSSSFEEIATASAIQTEEDGKAYVKISGNMYGTAIVTIAILETGLKEQVTVQVGKETVIEEPEKPVSPSEEPQESEKPVSPSEEPQESEKPVSPSEEPQESEKPVSPSEEPQESEKPVSPSEEPPVTEDVRLLGDTNCDGNVDLADAQLTLKAALKILSLNEKQIINADVDGEDGVSLADAQLILKAALKIIVLKSEEISLQEKIMIAPEVLLQVAVKATF